ncbi:MAG TPA: twin-arginine translocation signal domain-containing protein, partial [Gemmatimonadaceae bacterium]
MAVSRRDFLKGSAFVGAALALPGALFATEAGRFTARPKKPTKDVAPGENVLLDERGRRALLQIPPGYDPQKAAPFFLALHGASGSGDSMMSAARGPAEAHGVIVLSPSSRDGTWDAIRGRFSYDTDRIDQLLDQAFDRCVIDPSRLAIGGFSDGATYA